MSKKIDERVVEMQFDNREFEKNVSTSMSTLERLKNSLKNLTGASTGLEKVSYAAKKVDLNGISTGIEEVRARFSALEVVGVTALANIANQAVNTGKQMISALTIDPIKTGFQEYETQMGSIQTILANTQSKGSSLQDVNRALNELNKYADQTIYNFTEMTRNIGTFTAAGVDLDKSVTSIKGIANLAAISGSTSQQASVAMYQLSQALAAGRVSLMDWNSVVNAGMGGEVFQNALKRTATQMGTNVDALIEKYGSFRESLTQGNWLTAEVLTETLTQLSGAYSKADLIAQGYTEEQANEIVKLAETAVSAATEVKTFTQLWDTMKEAVQSGWAQTWQIIVGDFDEAKELLTGISNAVGGVIQSSSDARNKLLTEGLSSGWKQLLSQGISDEEGFKDSIKIVAKEHGIAIDQMVNDAGSLEKTFKQGWVTGDILTESLDRMTQKVSGMSEEQLKAAGYTQDQVDQLKELNEAVKNGTVDMDEFAKKMSMASGRENIIEGLKNVFTALGDAIAPIHEAFRDIFPPMTGEQLYSFTEGFRKLTEQFKISDETADKLKRTFSGVFSIVDMFGKAINAIISPISSLFSSGGVSGVIDLFLTLTASVGDFFTALNNSKRVGNFFTGIAGGLTAILGGIGSAIGITTDQIQNFGDVLSAIGDIVGNVVGKIAGGLGSVFSWISENLSVGDIFAGLAGGGIFALAQKIGGLLGKIGDAVDNFFGGAEDKISIGKQFSDMLGSVHDSLQAFTVGIKAGTLIAIAGAVGILSMALRSISELDAADIGKSLVAIGAMLAMLINGLKMITKTLSVFNSAGLFKASVSLIAMATALNIFAGAMDKLSGMKFEDIVKGLIGLGVGLLGMASALKFLDGVKINLRTSVAILAIAEASKILSEAMTKFGSMSWDEVKVGLTSMGVALGELVASLSILNKVGGFGSILGATAILVAVQSLDEISESLSKLGTLSWDSVKRGLTAMGGALAEFVVALSALSYVGGFGSILGGTGILIAAQSLLPISTTLQSLSGMSWEGIKRSLTAMGGALGELTVALAALSAIGGFGSILGGTAILIAAQSLSDIASAFESLSKYSWDEVKVGLTSMGGALAEIAVVTGALGKIAGFSGILGSGAILIVVQGLTDVASAFNSFSGYSWDEVKVGLTAMGGALAEIAVVAGALGTLTGFSGLLGAGTLVAAVQGLGQLADAFSVFSGMTWDGVKMGLVGMGGALTEVAVVTGLLGNLGGLASLVGAGSLTLAVQGLGQLADAFKKFGEMSWDEIKTGLASMGAALGEVAIGGLLNTLSGLGALSISAIAEPLGQLADSIKKWQDVTIPSGLGAQLGLLANGVMQFTLGGFGAGAISTVAEPLGYMADSVKKWKDVTVPEGLGENLSILAEGVKAFTFGGFGAGALAEAAEPLGQLADSVNKWNGVIVPDGMQSKLEGLANGVKAFTLTNWGAGGMGDAVEPLKQLAGAVSAWNGVVVPEGLQTNLESLANGVKAFNTGWFSDYDDFASVSEPLKQLATAVSAWNGVVVPEGMDTNLNALANGIKAFNGLTVTDLTSVCDALKNIGNAVQSISGIDIASVASSLTNFGNSLSNLNISSNSFANLGNTIVNGLVTSLNSGKARVQAAANSLALSAVNAFSSAVSGAASRSSSAGVAMVSGLASGIRSGVGTASSASVSVASATVNAINGRVSSFNSAGKNLANGLANGIRSASSAAKTAVSSMVSSAASAASSSTGTFVTAGLNAAAGFAAGIRSGSFAASLAAAAMASAAASAAKRNLQINSPSKVFRAIGKSVPEGFAQGISMLGNLVSGSVKTMGNNAIDGTRSAISRISDALSSDIDTQPRIKPIVDLDNVYKGVRAINGAFGMSPSVGSLSSVNSINSLMNRRIQNGTNNDVVSAIKDLDKTIAKSGGNSYTINGVTYEDGSAVSKAIETLVRATRIERRV